MREGYWSHEDYGARCDEEDGDRGDNGKHLDEYKHGHDKEERD